VVRSIVPADAAAASLLPLGPAAAVEPFPLVPSAVTSPCWEPSVRADGKASICGDVVGLGVCRERKVKNTPGVGGTAPEGSLPPCDVGCAGGDATTSTVMGGL